MVQLPDLQIGKLRLRKGQSWLGLSTLRTVPAWCIIEGLV